MTQCKSNLKNFGVALEGYAGKNGGNYPESLDALVPEYLSELPKCAAAGEFTYVMETGPEASGNTEKYPQFYQIRCQGSHHDLHGIKRGDYPRYDPVSGLIER